MNHASLIAICLSMVLSQASLAFPAAAEVLMKNGSVVSGTVVRDDGSGITLLSDEKEIQIPRSMIASIKTTPDARQSAPSSTTTTIQPQPIPVPVSQTPAAPLLQPPPSTSPGSPASSTPRATAPDQTTADRPYAGQPIAPVREQPVPMRLSAGIDVDFHLTSVINDDFLADTSNSESTNSLRLKPYVGMLLTPIFELRPAIQYSLNSYTYGYSPVDSLIDTNVIRQERMYSQSGLGIELGFLFHPVSRGVFRFVIGPALGVDYLFKPDTVLRFFNARDIVQTPESYRHITAALTVPFSFDFVPSKHLGIRISNELLRVQTDIYSQKRGGDNNRQTIKTTADLELSPLVTGFKVGLFWLF